MSEATNLICFSCKHFHRYGVGCDAFPEGIPDEIVAGRNKHAKPLPEQDNNIVYEPKTTKDE